MTNYEYIQYVQTHFFKYNYILVESLHNIISVQL